VSLNLKISLLGWCVFTAQTLNFKQRLVYGYKFEGNLLMEVVVCRVIQIQAGTNYSLGIAY
jgi:hypothetical protein